MFSKRQSEILGNLAKKKEIFTFDDLQKELKEDAEAKELLQKIKFIVDGEYEKAGVCKSTSKSESSNNGGTEKIELMM